MELRKELIFFCRVPQEIPENIGAVIGKLFWFNVRTI